MFQLSATAALNFATAPMAAVLPLAYIPCWWYLQIRNHERHPEIPNGLNYDL